jgi:hypothetical protein
VRARQECVTGATIRLPAVTVAEADPDHALSVSALYLLAQLRTRSVAARTTLRLSVGRRVDQGFTPAGTLGRVSADTMPHHERSRILPTAHEIRSVIINRLTTNRTR